MKLEHIAIWVKDIEKMKEFYIKYFNGVANDRYFNPQKQFESYFITFESGSRLEIMSKTIIKELNKIDTEEYYGYAHLAFSFGSKDKVNTLTARLKENGYLVVGEPRITGDGYYESCVLDPEGNRVEIME